MIWPRDSIRARLILLAALLTGAALLAGYLAIAAILEDFITDRFDAEAQAVAESLIAGAAAQSDGSLVLAPAGRDPRFELPLSGWFWQVAQDGQVLAKSPSLFDNVLKSPPGEIRGGAGIGPQMEGLRVMQTDFTLPDTQQRFTLTVTMPVAEIDAALARVRQPLRISLVVLGFALALASLVQVFAGLRSLDRLGQDLRAIREGRSQTLPLPAVAELRPLAGEINGLLDQNRILLTRARDHVGNLAHSLRTPLAALANTLPADHPAQALIGRMDRQIGWHLRRARSAAASRVLGQRTAVLPVVQDILMVLGPIIRERDLLVESRIEPSAIFAGERHDLEEVIGNLLENAAKWANRRVAITASTHSDLLHVQIADDGPGLAPEKAAQALTRGARLDETGPPGAGLGLAIVADLVALHGGRISLDRARLGGLSVRVELPAPALVQSRA